MHKRVLEEKLFWSLGWHITIFLTWLISNSITFAWRLTLFVYYNYYKWYESYMKWKNEGILAKYNNITTRRNMIYIELQMSWKVRRDTSKSFIELNRYTSDFWWIGMARSSLFIIFAVERDFRNERGKFVTRMRDFTM